MTPLGRVELGTLRQADLEEREKEEGKIYIDRTDGNLIRARQLTDLTSSNSDGQQQQFISALTTTPGVPSSSKRLIRVCGDT